MEVLTSAVGETNVAIGGVVIVNDVLIKPQIDAWVKRTDRRNNESRTTYNQTKAFERKIKLSVTLESKLLNLSRLIEALIQTREEMKSARGEDLEQLRIRAVGLAHDILIAGRQPVPDEDPIDPASPFKDALAQARAARDAAGESLVATGNTLANYVLEEEKGFPYQSMQGSKPQDIILPSGLANNDIVSSPASSDELMKFETAKDGFPEIKSAVSKTNFALQATEETAKRFSEQADRDKMAALPQRVDAALKMAGEAILMSERIMVQDEELEKRVGDLERKMRTLEDRVETLRINLKQK
jgi:hypothetical protein